MREIMIDGVKYVERMKELSENFVIVRTYSAGVFAGYLQSRKDREVVLRDAIRIWKWVGAASLSQLAMEGVTDPIESRFAMPVILITLTEAIEIISCTEAARQNIQAVKSWKV